MATCSRKLASSIKVLCGIAVLFSLVQLVITAISFTKPCPIGLYFTSYTQYGNGFWVGGPIFLLSAFITYVAQHSYFSTRRVVCVKAAAYLCVACIIGGVVKKQPISSYENSARTSNTLEKDSEAGIQDANATT
ncbi:uncharacterized protein TRIADDRAFT_57758 [Trichoplax adhaerens]|uniref:Uncharacterized protein n=1 Tax=Trichoplax adhaerens TaxID=10228 RepID=B3S0B9_TRIAD|nr:predicted protein [Trichoplax adhaerens]EDV23986.1 predicted protein [Trichoplax adhaerens]|eukprot:XP_002113512.1 predicted protein [Trichoplax adhaerens]